MLTFYLPFNRRRHVFNGLLKKWIQRNASLTFRLHPKGIIAIALKECNKRDRSSIFERCGYFNAEIKIDQLNTLDLEELVDEDSDDEDVD